MEHCHPHSELVAFTQGLEDGLGSVIRALAHQVCIISQHLRKGQSMDEAGSTNAFGDKQLKVDLYADQCIFAALRQCPAVATASSEEQSEEIDMGGQGFSVAFDPLDGSSIVDANFAVGAIFGIWRGSTLLGVSGNEQVAAAYAVFGPGTVLVLACSTEGASRRPEVHEFSLADDTCSPTWKHTRSNITIGEKKVFAPANLRAASKNLAYRDYVSTLIAEQYTLRYTGGFVPDVHHILTKGGGLFINPVSTSAPAKLRLLYECAPLAFIVEAAGGASSNGMQSILELPVTSLDARTPICLGSPLEVQKTLPCFHAMQGVSGTLHSRIGV